VEDDADLVQMEGPQSVVKRVAVFLRSVIPKDPWQLLFLAGTVLLFISPRTGWRPISLRPVVESVDHGPKLFDFFGFLIWPIVFGSLVAYYICFWSRQRPVRRILLAVFLPALLGLGLILIGYFQFTHSPRSVLDSRPGIGIVYEWFVGNIWKLPTGVYICALGLALLSVFTVRVHLGLSLLPISLREPVASASEDAASWKQYEWLIFVLVCPYFLIAGALGTLLAIPYLLGRRMPEMITMHLSFLSAPLEGLLMIGVLILILGKPGRDAARKSMRLPEPRYVLLAPVLAVAVGIGCAFLQFAIDRTHWAAHSFGKTSPPHFYSYFDVASAWYPWLLVLVFGAVAEEIVFRGVLLPRLMHRYGLQRGIFLTGMVWAAIHFHGDPYFDTSVPGVLYRLAWRILFCLTLNYVFCWMTLRWKSVIPSGLAHTVLNIIAISGINNEFPWGTEFTLTLWIVVALVLFRYLPVRDEDEAVANAAGTQPQTGV